MLEPGGPLTRLGAVAALLLFTGCATHGLSFAQDERVDIVSPPDRAEVTLPVTVNWTVEDFAIGPDAGSFAVFVDRAPQPSGKTLAWLFRGDDSCKGDRTRCAEAQFLADRNVHQTHKTAITFAQVPKRVGNDARREMHEVTVVLLNERGERVGEGAWSTQFEVKGEA